MVLSDFLILPLYLFLSRQPCEIISILDGKIAQPASTFTQQAVQSAFDHQGPHGERRE